MITDIAVDSVSQSEFHKKLMGATERTVTKILFYNFRDADEK